MIKVCYEVSPDGTTIVSQYISKEVLVDAESEEQAIEQVKASLLLAFPGGRIVDVWVRASDEVMLESWTKAGLSAETVKKALGMTPYKLYIFDVDGTLTTTKSGATFRETASDWQFLPGRVSKCQDLVAGGAVLALASNQGGVCFPWSKFSEAEIRAELEATGVQIGVWIVRVACSTPNVKALPQYLKANDERRKPGPGMLLEIMESAGVPASETLMIGDRPEDDGAAKAAGVDFQWAKDFFGDEK